MVRKPSFESGAEHIEALRKHAERVQQDRDSALDLQDYETAEFKDAQLETIQRAIEECRSGTYGVCEDCDQPIPAVRLNAIPGVKLCVQCQSKEDRSGHVSADSFDWSQVTDGGQHDLPTLADADRDSR